MSIDAERVQRYRDRHPDRALYSAQMTVVRGIASRIVANRHGDEYEQEIRRLCKERGLPRYLPPLPADEDGRKAEGR